MVSDHLEQFPVIDIEPVLAVERGRYPGERRKVMMMSPPDGMPERRSGWGRRATDILDTAFEAAENSGLDAMPSYVFNKYTHLNTVDHYEQFGHMQFTEETDPVSAREAWRVQGVGYLAMNFVNESALTPDKHLWPDIDHARGPNVAYYMGYRKNVPSRGISVVRVAGVPGDGTWRDLPTAVASEAHLSDEGRVLLEGVDNPERRLKEIGGLAGPSPLAIYESIRRIIQGAQGKDEVWFFNGVETTFNSFCRTYGPTNFVVAGSSVSFDGDTRVRNEIALKPTIVYPDKFISNILADYERATTEEVRRKLGNSFMFMMQGLDLRFVSPHMFVRHREMTEELIKRKRQEQSA